MLYSHLLSFLSKQNKKIQLCLCYKSQETSIEDRHSKNETKSEYERGLTVIGGNSTMGLRGWEKSRWWEEHGNTNHSGGDEHRDNRLRCSSTLISGRICLSRQGSQQSKGLVLQHNVHAFPLSCSLLSFLPKRPPLHKKKRAPGSLQSCRIYPLRHSTTEIDQFEGGRFVD